MDRGGQVAVAAMEAAGGGKVRGGVVPRARHGDRRIQPTMRGGP